MPAHRHVLSLLLFLAGVAALPAADPVLRNWGMGAFRGMDTSVTVQSLSATDTDTAAASLVYTITTAPTKGTLLLNGVSLAVASTFTQADIAGGLLTYRHVAGANDAMDVVAFTLSDGTVTQAHTLRILVGPSSGSSFRMQKVGEYRVPSGYNPNGGVAEIVAYDPASRRLMVVNGATNTVDMLAFGSDEFTSPTLIASLNPSAVVATATNVTSVASKNGLIAAAVGHTTKTSPGYVFFYSAATGAYVSHIDFSTALSQVGGIRGALPDMITFTPDGTKVLVAIEAEPSGDYTIDPLGGLVVVGISSGVPAATATFIGFDDANTAAYSSAGIRIFNNKSVPAPAASAAADLEPEYITVSADSTTAFVSCQENNALAIFNLSTLTLSSVAPLGTKDHSVVGNELDASDEDAGTNTNSGTPLIKIQNYPLKGLYMPDGIASFASGGQTYVVSANEGDAREYWVDTDADGEVDGGELLGMVEATRVRGGVTAGFVDSATWASVNTNLGFDSGLGRLNITRFNGDTNADLDVDELHAFGARSFSVWNSSGGLVWDSGAALENFIATYLPTVFNANHTSNSLENRSDDKGPEPEGITTGTVNGRTYAFIGLERISGVMVYDITTPTAPTFVTYYTGRLFNQTPGNASGGDLGPEGMLFIDGTKSPTGRPMLIVGNEVSGTVAIHEIITVPYVETLIAADAPTAGDVSGVTTVVGTPITFPTANLATSDPQTEALVINGGNAAGSTLTVSGGTATYTPGARVSGADSLTFSAVDHVAYSSEIPRGLMVTTASGIDTYQSGYGSSMANVPGTNDEFWLMGDRGPNVDGTAANTKLFPDPNYQPRMIKVRVLADGSMEKLNDIRFKNGDGSPMTGKPFIGAGAGSTGETGYALDLATNLAAITPLPSDPDGLDPEGLVVRNDGSFWVSDEYGPWIVNFDATGTVTQRIGPFGTTGTVTAPNPNARKLPLVLAKRRANRGMEGLTITPSGWLVGMMQSPMFNPSSAAIGGTSGAGASRVCRILFFNPTDGLTKQYTYVLDSTSTAVSEILAVNENEFLVLERDGNWPGGAPASTIKKIYRIHVGQATDVSDPADGANGKLYKGKTVEELKTTAGLLAEGITAVRKWLAVDMLTLTNQNGVTYPHDKPEGLALVNGGKTLVLVNDDDFGVAPTAPFSGIAAKEIPSLANRADFNSLWFIGLDDGSLAITVSNTAPVAAVNAVTTAEDTATTGVVTLTDPDAPTGLTTTVSVADATLIGATITGTGLTRTLNITPLANRHGATNVSVTVSDGFASTATVVAVTVTPVNDAPLAANAAITATVGVAKAGTLIADDVDGGALTFSKVSDPTKGTVTITAATGAYTYTANAGTSGTDTFTFKVNDGTVDSLVATVTVTISPPAGSGTPATGSNDDSKCGLGSGVGVLIMSLLLALKGLLVRARRSMR